MNEEDARLMQTLGITATVTVVYEYSGFKYQKLEDAVRYARIAIARNNAADSTADSSK